GAGGLFRLPRAVPLKLAMQLALTGDPIDAERAYTVGLVNELCEPGTALDRALALAARICANAPRAVQARRDVVLRGMLASDVDGFMTSVTETEQRNVRYTTELSATDGASAGPFSFQVLEPMKTWHVAVGPNPTGLEFDLTWRARAPAWFGEVGVKEGDTVTA